MTSTATSKILSVSGSRPDISISIQTIADIYVPKDLARPQGCAPCPRPPVWKSRAGAVYTGVAQRNALGNSGAMSDRKLSQLRQLEAESIQIIREAAAEFDKPVMMYSVGKDSSVMLRLAEKAFAPGPLPFPLLHVDTTWKFQDMYRYRDLVEAKLKGELIKYVNTEGVEMGMNPFDFGSKKYTDIMKTEGLKQALTKYEFDCAFGGARRDEEKSRAKERIFSFRDANHVWDPKNQRPELWNIYNAKIKKGENVRVFPLSNWTELDVWLYVWLEKIPVVPLYFAKERPVVERAGTWILVDDDRMRLEPGEKPQMKRVRFRTLGCYPLSGAVESDADTVPKVIREMLLNRFSERQGRLIDFDEEGSMEAKKREGYF
ncbi:MAG: sulfate adenylyltransferase subunit CysD [Myxococcales bacterium]|nr:sulfate adenylyltransferase subunit CysD [Myxococcales bacterium]MDH3842837.1 sulfate adenylyltransferase subunit CysD [Myxococcales bacterium]